MSEINGWNALMADETAIGVKIERIGDRDELVPIIGNIAIESPEVEEKLITEVVMEKI